MPVMKPKKNSFTLGGKPIVSIVPAKTNLKESILSCVNALGGFEKIIKKGDRVLVKPNLNSDDPFPASTSPDMGRALTELLFEFGASEVVWAESSGLYWLPTDRAWNLGLREQVERANGRTLSLEKMEWVYCPVPDWGRMAFTKTAFDYDKLIWLPCLKTHRLAEFSLSLKLIFGWIHLKDRFRMHENLQKGIADVNTVIHPDLVLMDGRKAFITGGPAKGDLVEPNLLLASADRIALDVEGIKVLQSFPGNSLNKNPWSYTQISKAVELGLGSKTEKDYAVKRLS